MRDYTYLKGARFIINNLFPSTCQSVNIKSLAINNPRLYCFSSALKLNHLIRKARELGLGLNLLTEAAAPINVLSWGNK